MRELRDQMVEKAPLAEGQAACIQHKRLNSQLLIMLSMRSTGGYANWKKSEPVIIAHGEQMILIARISCNIKQLKGDDYYSGSSRASMPYIISILRFMPTVGHNEG